MARTLRFHAARMKDGVVKLGVPRFLMVSEIHRIEGLSEHHPEREGGAQALIVCRDKDGETYFAAESAEELARALES